MTNKIFSSIHACRSNSRIADKIQIAAQHLVAYLYQQSRAANARSRFEFVAGRRSRDLGRHLSFHRKSDAAAPWERARLLLRFHDYGPRRSERFDRHGGGKLWN